MSGLDAGQVAWAAGLLWSMLTFVVAGRETDRRPAPDRWEGAALLASIQALLAMLAGLIWWAVLHVRLVG